MSALLYTCTGTNATGVMGGDVSVALVTIACCKCQSVWINVMSALLYTCTGTNATGVMGGDVGVALVTIACCKCQCIDCNECNIVYLYWH